MKCLSNKTVKPLDSGVIALTKESIFKLPRPHLGQMAVATDINETYIYTENGWKVVEGKLEGKGLEMNLYNLNQSIVAQLPIMTDFSVGINLMNEFQKATNNNYYMLYAKDISYFTIFHVEQHGEFSGLGNGVVECLLNVGGVKSIDYTEAKDAVEIWIEGSLDEPFCAYLFPYDTGIVTIKEA